ncbi:unnamed protein product [Rotaria sordida]|uniref:Uncharacterized protein n=1 Tax=Rotaria sordida TaxID=392033 RepID=A0A818Q547_9BILA|nr:unnamed protein product [Rotaria sordida]CAF3635933.1 unnamed protein product [Rotaria sordida]
MSKKSHDQSSPSDLNQHRTQQSSLLAQFTNATAPGYQPQPQATTSTHSSASGFNQNNTSYNTNSTKSNSTASANQTAKNVSNTFLPLPSQTINLATFKGFKFVTLDGLLIETRDIYDKISDTYQWEMCQDQEDRCIAYIRDQCVNKRTFLITSGGLGKNIVPKIHELPQLYAVYIYCADVVYHQEWACKFSKVRVVCNNDDKYLLPQFAVDVAQATIDWGDALVKDGKRDAAKEKFQKALSNLTEYARNPDPTMVNEVKIKLDECR